MRKALSSRDNEKSEREKERRRGHLKGRKQPTTRPPPLSLLSLFFLTFFLLLLGRGGLLGSDVVENFFEIDRGIPLRLQTKLMEKKLEDLA